MSNRPIATNAVWFEQVEAMRLTLLTLGLVGMMIAAALSHDLAANSPALPKAPAMQSIGPPSPGS